MATDRSLTFSTTSSRSSSSLFKTASSANTTSTEWKKNYPSKPPIYVRVAGVVNPGKFWVRNIPMQKKQRRKMSPGSPQAIVFDLEKKLADMYNVEPKLNPEGEVLKPVPSMKVAVRPSYRSSIWYRGKILHVMYKGEVTVKVSTMYSAVLNNCAVWNNRVGLSVFEIKIIVQP